jgi:DNA-binding transcriptional LysR family regulator
MSLELRQLATLVAVVDAGSFTAAAADLHLSQASVSRTIAALERELGVDLLRRTTRSVSPTASGVAVLERARRVLADVAELRRTAAQGLAEVRFGYVWSALGRHTLTLQRRWARSHPGLDLVFVQTNSPTAGLLEGTADIAVLRRTVTDPRLASAFVGAERRYAAVAADDPLASRRFVRLADFAGRTLGVDARTGTTTPDLWPAEAGPGAIRDTHSVDEWLTMIAAGQAVGITSEATVAHHPRPGVVYRPVRDAEPIAVRLVWWVDSPPAWLSSLVALVRETLAAG